MIKNVHLGFFINEYNKDPIYYELAAFKDADDLDRFMDYFYNNNEKIRKLFDQDISEYSIDNIEQFRKVEEKKDNNFRGRISAYYFNELGKIEFLELPTPKRKPIRDYKRIPDLETCYRYLCKVFNDAEKKLNEKYKNRSDSPSKGEFAHYICEKLKQASYELSQNELYSLVCYYNHPTEKNKKACFTLLKTNLKQYYAKKELAQKKEERELSKEAALLDEQKLTFVDEASEDLKRDIKKTNETMDYDNIFLHHDLDEIDKYTNAFKKGK